MNTQKIEKALKAFSEKHKANPNLYKERTDERNERLAYYQSWTAEKIKKITIDDMYEYIGKLWSMIMWGNKKYVVDKIIENNGFEKLKEQLVELLFVKKDTSVRWDSFLNNIKGMGPSTISELLGYINPDEYVMSNKNTVACLNYLEVSNMPLYNYQYTGKRFVDICSVAQKIAEMMKQHGITDSTLFAVDYFLWDEVLLLAKGKHSVENDDAQTVKSSKSKHNEIVDMITEIGRLLGFESNSEVKVAAGAKIDAIWEAKIGNMGKAIYAFEVQDSGSIDSLLMNLMKAKNNHAVQAVVTVSDIAQIEKIKRESVGTPIANELRTWDCEDVIEVYEALVKAHASINKLNLVPDSFI